MNKYFVLFLLLLSVELVAQPGQLNVSYDGDVRTLIDKYERSLRADQTISAFTIQLLQDKNRQEVYDAKASFMQKFPQMKATINYAQPNYKLRVGAFRTKIEAYKWFKKIDPYFNRSFIVPDKVSIHEIKSYEQH